VGPASAREFVNPVHVLIMQFVRAFDYAVPRCGLDDYVAIYCYEFYSPPTQAHVSTFNYGRAKMLKAYSANPFKNTLAPKDLERLVADPVKRAQWIEHVTHSLLLPPLRELVHILRTKVRLASSGFALPASLS
jgi:hypothetical protein